MIYIGIERFSWYGKACSEPGAAFESQGKFLLNMFIAQLVMMCVYNCFANCASRRMTCAEIKKEYNDATGKSKKEKKPLEEERHDRA